MGHPYICSIGETSGNQLWDISSMGHPVACIGSIDKTSTHASFAYIKCRLIGSLEYDHIRSLAINKASSCRLRG